MKYSIIYADPPWRTDSWAKWQKNKRQPPYPTMTDAELLDLPIKEMAATDSALFMWVLDHKLTFAIELGEAWGYTFNTVAFYWLKRTAFGDGWNLGTGYTTRAGSVEMCLLFNRGSGVSRQSKKVRRLYDDIVFYPETITHPVMEHSRKPDEIRRRIEQLYGDLPRVELFARRPAPGWDVWGNEVESSPSTIATLGEPERMTDYAKSP